MKHKVSKCSFMAVQLQKVSVALKESTGDSSPPGMKLHFL